MVTRRRRRYSFYAACNRSRVKNEGFVVAYQDSYAQPYANSVGSIRAMATAFLARCLAGDRSHGVFLNMCIFFVSSWFFHVCSKCVGGTRPKCGRSALGEFDQATPMVLLTRGFLDRVRRLMKGDLYIGRSSTQRGPGRSPFCNFFKAAVKGEDVAISRFADMLTSNEALCNSFWTLSSR